MGLKGVASRPRISRKRNVMYMLHIICIIDLFYHYSINLLPHMLPQSQTLLVFAIASQFESRSGLERHLAKQKEIISKVSYVSFIFLSNIFMTESRNHAL